MSKLQDIRNLIQEHAVSVSSSPGDWMDYMDTASRLYRYSFSDQLLIHAQRPQATACASLELWNQKMFRWVNRGAKGIALIDETTQKTRPRYVFDVQDTHMVNGGRTPYLWKLQEEQQEEVLLHLEEVYGLEAKDTKNLSDALMATARYMVEENLEEYLDGLLYMTEGTYLEELEEDTIRSEFRSLLTDSIYYTLASRCGLDPMEWQEEMDFVHITDYNRLSVLTFIGNATSRASESVLVDIGRYVHRISLEEMKKGIENSEERNYNNFNTLIRESKENNDTITEKEYSQEKYNKKKKRSLRVAKLSCYSGELAAVFGWNSMLSLILFLVLLLGTSALPYILDVNIDFGPETFWCRGGIFVNICLVLLILFSIAAFTYAISYKVAEVMCILLDGGLDGAIEVNDAAMRANFKGQVAKAAGVAYVDTEALAGPMNILTRYCTQNNTTMLTPRFFTVLHRILVVAQIFLACISIFELFH